MNFLPEDYQSPKPTSQLYFRPLDGENRIRILSKPIFGWEDWTIDKKPVRFKMNEKPVKPIDPKKAIKHFWAFIVWNVQLEQIQIMQITQATIRTSLEALCKDQDWGSPFDYDIKIIKKGEGIETEYTVNPAPHKEVSIEVLQAFKERPICLDALFLNADPFSPEWKAYTKLMPDADEENKQPITGLMGEHVNPAKQVSDKITADQFFELNELKVSLSKDAQKGFDEYLSKAFSTILINLPSKEYEGVKTKLNKKLLEEEMAKK